MSFTHDYDNFPQHPGPDPNRPDPDTGWQPGMPTLILLAGEDGAILSGWRAPVAYSAEGVIIAMADEIDAGGHIPEDRFPPVNPAAWFLVSSEHAPGADAPPPHPELGPGSGHQVNGPADCPRCSLLRENEHWMTPGRPHSGVTYDLSRDRASGSSPWQGRSGELTVAMAGAGTALDLSAAVRAADGTPMYAGDRLTSAVAGWLAGHGIDPDTGTGTDGRFGIPADLLAAAPARPAMEALARETEAAQTGARGAALELAAAVRNPDGSWRACADLYAAIAGWLGGMGVSPADVPIPAAAWADPGVLRAVTPVPPDGPLSARHRWVCSYALTVQARLVAVVPGCAFHGTPAGPGTNVAIESASGRFLGELANTGYRKSPTGFAAGDEGSGAAALARSLLTAALGSLAACPGCLGSGRITYLVTQDAHEDPVPWQPAHDTLADPGPDLGDGEDAAWRRDRGLPRLRWRRDPHHPGGLPGVQTAGHRPDGRRRRMADHPRRGAGLADHPGRQPGAGRAGVSGPHRSGRGAGLTCPAKARQPR